MKHLFLDTNVLIDFLADRKPFAVAATRLFDLSAKRKLTLYVSSVSFNNIYYIIRQSKSHAETLKLLLTLSELVEIVAVTPAVISKALTSDIRDFEAAIQYHCAKTIIKLDALVTRDTRDFRKSALPVLNPTEAIGLLESMRG